MSTAPPILYSFRRCPYAIRARLALLVSGTNCELREVVLRDKPDCMLSYSPKGTVPVLILPDGSVIDESLDIMHYSLKSRDPGAWLDLDEQQGTRSQALIQACDGEFKHHLDRYKYANRYEGADAISHRSQAEAFIAELNSQLQAGPYLLGEQHRMADAAIAPFVRQFANADRAWFDATPYPFVQRWLGDFLQSPLFVAVMSKCPQWHEGDPVTLFADL